jgi:hypothetical protein
VVARYESGILQSNGARYSLGKTGDVVVVGDWDCDGIATAVLYRPATGWLHRFDRWAAPGEELTPTTSEHIGTGRTIRRMARGDCDEVAVVS